MSDSDSDPDHGGECQIKRRKKYVTNDTLITFRPSEEIFRKWRNIPEDVRKQAAQRMKVCSFWLPILLQPDDTTTFAWGVDVGLINPINSEKLTLQHLNNIEIVEVILQGMETGTITKDHPRHVIAISNMFNLRSKEVFEHAVRYLERAGDHGVVQRMKDLGRDLICFTALHLIFTEFAKFIQEMGSNMERTLKALNAKPADYLIEKSDDMRIKGNDSFQKQQYEEAIKFYSKAAKYYPDNHLIYGNRAQCYLRCKEYLKAVGDGKRAILIKPSWAKGHYRFAEAWFYLGEVKLAFQANCSAKSLFRDDQEKLKELEQQHNKFLSELKSSEQAPYPQKLKGGLKRPHSAKNSAKTDSLSGKAEKGTESKMGKKTGKNEKITQPEVNGKDPKPSKSENGESNASAKKKSKSRVPLAEDAEPADSKSDVVTDFRSRVQDAFTALYDQRSRNAEQAFSQALDRLESKTPTLSEELGLSTLDELLLLYGRASALTEIGQPEELSQALKVLEKIKSYEERTFQCLVYYAIGRVYLRENRFADALQQFSDSLQMSRNQITPGKLTWPLTKDIVKETQPEYFQELLESAIELCKFPPVPDAICRLQKCLYPYKSEIYFTDPDFKGYIQIYCCQSCRVEFHISCWKSLKATSFTEKNEKEILQEPCLTPDCIGQISSIKIFGPTGLVKCKFETVIPKKQLPKKLRVNQKCTSIKKLKLKEERKLRRKQHKQTFQEKEPISDESTPQRDNSVVQAEQKAWLLYRDRVLLQISQNVDLLREERGLRVSALATSLKPWLELDLFKGNPIAGRLLNWQEEGLETLGQAVELLLERNNRVWARVFIQQLSSCVDVNPKLRSWAGQLDEAGLNAARSFVERYTGQLEQLDLSLLLNFGPMEAMIIEKLEIKPEFFSSIGFTLTDYLKQATEHDVRLFIWTLEEHREEYVSCHPILDEYFDMMDGHCSVLKKSDENNSPIRGKSRARKKKHKEPKGVVVFPGLRGLTPREDSEQDFFEDDSLSFLHPADPFTVPSYLREQVADFEDQYNRIHHGTHLKKILDNHPDTTKECLYDYFAQILEEHGPLSPEDPLLVGELQHFPAEAQRKFQDAGGFEPFLLESLRFVKMGKRVGLAHHAVSLQQVDHNATSLDDLDEIADPEYSSTSPPDFYISDEMDFTSHCEGYYPEAYPILPNPYTLPATYGFYPAGNEPPYHWNDGSIPFLPSSYDDQYAFEADDAYFGSGQASSVASLPTKEDVLKRDAAVQTCKDASRTVAVNTELLEPFERSPGDINKKEKSNKNMENQIRNMANGSNSLSKIQARLSKKEELVSLENNVKRITTNIQVTNKELVMFQQKLEEEVKKDQKEKKANQEVLKSLKTEIEQLVEEKASLTRSIQERKSRYDAKLNEFLEYSRDQELYDLHRELADGKFLLAKLDEALHRIPNKDLEAARNGCRAKVEEIERSITAAQKRFQDQLEELNNRMRGCEALPVRGTNQNQSEHAAAPLSAAAQGFVPQTSARASGGSPAPPQLSSPPAPRASASPGGAQHRAGPRRPEPPHSSVFDKAMETLASMFPTHSRSDLKRYIQEYRASRGTLSSMTLQDVVGGVTQTILDHQERQGSARAGVVGRGSPSQRGSPPLASSLPVWQPVTHQRPKACNALNMDDPCIICHEDMSPEETCVLECRHSFHEECIRSWLKEQSTCPTCRNHALLPDEFPALSGKRRQAP
ncbi:unnamed protein product [Menidia menidia]|uniref:RING-type E3 ubiquitin transferase n=1 Tax=Menidia menidia TaxID=238744 RepID=A0A8S4AIQ3_9TELE|nr:unnamed protein product [Menidia menidia]